MQVAQLQKPSAISIPSHHHPSGGHAWEDPQKMPGHWLLAKLGKRVLRPGGLELTRAMLKALAIGPRDSVVEFAPGMGVTARLTLACKPLTYTAIERDETAAKVVGHFVTGPQARCLVGTACETGLPNRSATVVYGEAMLTMQTLEEKRAILEEAYRLLEPGGRYGIHELSLKPDDLPEAIQEEISREMSRNIHVGARPLTVKEWRDLLISTGFIVLSKKEAPMHLLEPMRVIRDEGFLRAMRFVFNLLTKPAARKRVLSMARMFRKHRKHLAAVSFVAHKPD